ncbi:MAG: [FeFe] hydrogenase, group A [Endomicrobium sp.]|jgi:NADH-quinone oxidoreductase subunit G|nr:[FeFe] hydrogenase, group A [Endomicrobium sp.]
MEKYLIINNEKISFDHEQNILEIIKKTNINLPTLCYNADISIYGSCRLCLIEIDGKGITPACSTLPEHGMNIKTSTEKLFNIRRIIVELLLANHDKECTICQKSGNCKLQTLSRQLNIKNIRFKNIVNKKNKDTSTHALIIDSNKCILCGNCVRFCSEVQAVGTLCFMNRGPHSIVSPNFNKNLASSKCVYCGQCARVCPTGAIIPKSEISYLWKVLNDPTKKVIIAIAPAVRASIGEIFGLKNLNGVDLAGKIVTSLKLMGFSKVFDISFMADMTIIEETHEFLNRIINNNIPMFTSCCPAWVNFVEQYYPDFIKYLSTCRSPQGIYGSLSRKIMPKILDIPAENLIVVSMMPCLAKKYEAMKFKFHLDNCVSNTEIDYVLTTQEFALMIEASGINFCKVKSSDFDMPFGFKTGAGILFGISGGVTEAIIRNIKNNKTVNNELFQSDFLYEDSNFKSIKVNINNKDFKIAIIHGLRAAKNLLENIIKTNKSMYDFVEVMACPGGCIGGAGQPIYNDPMIRNNRTEILCENDSIMEFHKSKDNLHVQKIYDDYIGTPGNQKAYEYFHTSYKHNRQFPKISIISNLPKKDTINIDVCLGKNCIKVGARKILEHIINFSNDVKFKNHININIIMCLGKCSKGPNVSINVKIIECCTLKFVEKTILNELNKINISSIK